MQVFNRTRNAIFVHSLEIPNTFVERSRGLLGRASLGAGNALLINRCRWVHTFFMQFTIDLVFLNRSNQVVKLVHGLVPNRFSPFILSASKTLELPEGTIAGTNIAVGDQLEIGDFKD